MEKVATMEDATGEVVEAKEEEEVVLPGFRFHPTDQELVGFYLPRKVEKKPIRIDVIKQVDIYKYDPWDLPRVSSVGDKEWYFFCLRGRKYRNSIRPNRVTSSGFWKATGIDRPVYSTAGQGHDCIGLKKSLVYYRGSAGKGSKTDWMMHEFRLPTAAVKSVATVSDGCNIPEAESWTICRIFKRTSTPCKKQHLMGRQLLPSESNSKASTNAESKHSVITYIEDTESNNSVATYFDDIESNNSVITYFEGRNQICAGQWNPTEKAPSVATQHPNFFNSSPSEFVFDDGSWDELGRIIESAVDPSLACPWV